MTHQGRTNRRILSSAARLLSVCLVAALVLGLLLMFFENRLIYFPTRYPDGDWQPVGLDQQDVWFEAADGTRLHGWYCPHRDPRAVVLFTHGNAGNLSYRADVLRLLRHRLGVSVMIFDYRGYGRSEGQPDERGILQDAQAAHAWLAQHVGIEPTDVVLFGRSLGGAVAVDLAARHGARGLILDRTFTSLPDVAAHCYPWIPVRRLMQTQFNSLEKIGRYHGPLLQSHGDADEIVPYELGRRLFEAANEPKRFVTLNGDGHNGPIGSTLVAAVDEFLSSL